MGDKFRQEIKQEDDQSVKRRQEEAGYKSSTGYGGKFGVQTDRVDKSAMGWDHTSAGASHESQAKQSDYKAGFVGNREAESPSPVGTNYQKTKPDIPKRHATNLKSKFEGMARQSTGRERRMTRKPKMLTGKGRKK